MYVYLSGSRRASPVRREGSEGDRDWRENIYIYIFVGKLNWFQTFIHKQKLDIRIPNNRAGASSPLANQLGRTITRRRGVQFTRIRIKFARRRKVLTANKKQSKIA